MYVMNWLKLLWIFVLKTWIIPKKQQYNMYIIIDNNVIISYLPMILRFMLMSYRLMIIVKFRMTLTDCVIGAVQMSWNWTPPKCFKMYFFRLKKKLVNDYHLFDDHIIRVRNLGVVFKTNLSFQSYSDYICVKALRILRFLTRNTKYFRIELCLKTLYTS